MKKALLLVAVLVLAIGASACSEQAQEQVEEAADQVAPTIESAAQSAATEVMGGMQTAAPTLQAAGTSVAEAVESTMAKVVALATVWEWQGTLMNDGTERVPEDPSMYTLDIKRGGEIAIKADCNNVTGTYVEEDGSLTVTLGASTLVACPEGSLGDAFVQDLSNVGSAFMDGDDLILEIKFDSGSMRFSPAE